MMTYADLARTLGHAFAHVYHQDHANAAMHCATVRYSPITFRLAEALHGVAHDEDLRSLPATTIDGIDAVMADRGRYKEDPGR